MLFGKKQNKQIDPLQTIIDNIVIDAGLSNLPEADMLAFKSNLEMQFNSWKYKFVCNKSIFKIIKTYN